MQTLRPRRFAPVALAALLLLFPGITEARSAVARAAFQRAHPCPSTGAARGPCPGYVVDHIKPLCAGGADSPRNMQWQTLPAAKRKDARERRRCRPAR